MIIFGIDFVQQHYFNIFSWINFLFFSQLVEPGQLGVNGVNATVDVEKDTNVAPDLARIRYLSTEASPAREMPSKEYPVLPSAQVRLFLTTALSCVRNEE